MSNSPTEFPNLKIKNTNRVVREFSNFTNNLLRLFLNHGRVREDHLTTRIKNRRPNLMA